MTRVTGFGRGRRRNGGPRGFAGWLTLAFLLLQVFSAGIAFPAPSPRGADAGLDHLEICTAGGMVDLGTVDKPLAVPAGHAAHCVFCLPLLHGSILSPALAVSLPVSFVRLAAAPAIGEGWRFPLARGLAGAASPQAPPPV